jgi:hypothetical protein
MAKQVKNVFMSGMWSYILSIDNAENWEVDFTAWKSALSLDFKPKLRREDEILKGGKYPRKSLPMRTTPSWRGSEFPWIENLNLQSIRQILANPNWPSGKFLVSTKKIHKNYFNLS